MPAAPPQIRIGISGWTYAPWRGVFFPDKLPHAQELSYASRHVNSIEINGTFYSLQTPARYQKWYAATPRDFVFTVKANRFITHTRRLKDVEVPIANFLASGVLALREKLGPILWQFPPSLKYDYERFEHFLKLLPRDTLRAREFCLGHCDTWMTGRRFLKIDKLRPLRHAIEVRNESFRVPEFKRLMKAHEIAWVISDSSGAWPYFEEMTADFVYARLHGDGKLYAGDYGDRALCEWAGKVKKWKKGHRDVFVYFDNDVKVKAPFDAVELSARLHTETVAKAA